MSRPRLLDLFCCAGGAGMGYHRAGFEVIGVDIEPQPDYPFEFVQADVMALRQDRNHGCWHEVSSLSSLPGRLSRCLGKFDAVHASPPCQASTALTKGTNKATRSHLHVDLIGEVRGMLDATGLPYVIENVQGAKMRRDLTLCGEMFRLGVIRHRLFELGGWSMPQPKHKPHRGRVRGWRHGKYFNGPYVAVYGDGGGKGTVEEWQQAMGIDWLSSRAHLSEAIPPAYTEFIGRQLIEQIGRVAA